MAKQIKSVQCPQCGSTQQNRLKEDHYKCESCGAEYFLDNDDVNVNINHNHSPKGVDKNLKYVIIGLGVFFGVIILISIVSSIVSSFRTPSPSYTTYSVSESKPNEKKEYTERIKFSALDRSGSPIMLYLSERDYDYSDRDRNTFFVVFYDYIENKIIKEESIAKFDIGEKNIKFEYAYMPAIDKDIVLVNGRKIFEVDFKNLLFKDISVELLADYPEFSSGVASAKFIPYFRGEGFILVSNMGKEFYFVPSFKKMYTQDRFFEAASSGMRGLSSNAVNRTYYVFSEESRDFPDEQIELLKIVYKYNNGGPENKAVNPSWRKQYAYSGIIYDNTPFKKIIVDKDRERVVSCDNITPGRIYFSGRILNQQDEDKLLISFKPTISPDEKRQIQLLDLTTKEPIWTVTTDEDFAYRDAIKAETHYIATLRSDKFLKINSKDGSNEVIELVTRREYR